MNIEFRAPESAMPKPDPENPSECQFRPFQLKHKIGKLFWLVRPGSPVKKGEILCEAEVEKATLEFPSPCDGILDEILVSDGESFACDELLAVIRTDEEDHSVTDLYLIGGFLGAGKTTLLAYLAECFAAEGERPGLITNDQAPGLVDTARLADANPSGEPSGLPAPLVEEVSGSCFCCNFPGFAGAIDALLKKDADVIFAEPVGSCTDLTATIVQPLADKRGDRLRLMPFSVLVDPARLKDLLAGGNAGLAPSAAYILRMQLAEADVILINKTDLLSTEERLALEKAASERFPEAEIFGISALTGEGVAEWLAFMQESDLVPGSHPADVDYDIYAEGEAVLGWLNMDVTLRGEGQSWLAFANDLLAALSTRFEAAGQAVGHVKLLLRGANTYIRGNLTGRADTLRVEGADGADEDVSMIFNARAETAPEDLFAAAVEDLRKVCGSAVQSTITNINCLQPGRPNPTYRYARGADTKKKIDLFLISGFLGSGKTTFLKNILERKKDERIGVIVNEFGSLGLDAATLQLPSDKDIPMVQINNGSIFCACLKGGFVKTLADFLELPIDRLYVEASGMADPSSMEKLLAEMVPFVQKKRDIKRDYNYRGSICVVDAVNFEDLCATVVAGYNQVQKSNLILLNKTDLCDPETVAALRGELEGINPRAYIYETTYAQVPDEILDQYLAGETTNVGDTTNRCDNRLFAGVLQLDETFGEAEMLAFLKELQEEFVRIKGTFLSPDGLRRVEGVGDLLTCEPTGPVPADIDRRIVIISAAETDLTAWLAGRWSTHFSSEFRFRKE